jgi:hypothetical protein
MMADKYSTIKEKIYYGLNKTHERLIEFKRQKKSAIVVMVEGKIKRITPEEIKSGK